MDFDTKSLWCQQIERRLFTLSAMVQGNLPAQADRIADVVEQIDELRKEIKTLRDRIDKASEYVKANIPKK
jgi:hypothetical protein